jgi:hypothetical protein
MLPWILAAAALVAVVLLARSFQTRSPRTSVPDDTPPDVASLARGDALPDYRVGASIVAGKATGYGYAEDPTGGGSIGYKGHPLRFTSDFFAGRSTYVSIALNPDLMKSLWRRSDTQLKNAPMFFSPALDKRYEKELQRMGLKHLPLVAMDIGPGVARHQVDVYVDSKAEAFSLPGSPEVVADIMVRRNI